MGCHHCIALRCSLKRRKTSAANLLSVVSFRLADAGLCAVAEIMCWDSRALLVLLLFASAFAARAQLFITNLNRIITTTANTISVKTNAPAGQSFTAVT